MSWTIENNVLSGIISLETYFEFKDIFAEYKDFIKKWQSLRHPNALFPERVEYKTIESKNIFETSGIIDRYPSSQLSDLLPGSLSTFEKISILKQTMNLDIYLYRNQLFSKVWEPDNLFIHQSGYCQLLPPSPADWLEIANGKSDNKSFEAFGLKLFGLKLPGNINDWKALERKNKIPKYWLLFFKEYSSLKESDTLKKSLNQLFSDIFFSSWIYMSFFDLALKDRLLTKQEYKKIEEIKNFIGIPDEVANCLEILSQKSDLSFPDLIDIN
ncbi:MAG: hypothetical protein JSV88_19070 [Candidatus Aminicenantes bacterium]|nr:MAG: hypothetical protein JSV88_19070 [Candidatus Aminicenantes bacterium]